MDWLSRMVESPTWRQTIYELAQHPRNEDCPFLSLAMPCIAVKDSLIGELISVPLAWNTLEIFLKCVAHVLNPLLAAGETVKDGLLTHSVAFLQPRKPNCSESGVRTIENATLLSEISEFVSCSSTVEDTPAIGSLASGEQNTDSFNGPSGMLPHFLVSLETIPVVYNKAVLTTIFQKICSCCLTKLSSGLVYLRCVTYRTNRSTNLLV